MMAGVTGSLFVCVVRGPNRTFVRRAKTIADNSALAEIIFSKRWAKQRPNANFPVSVADFLEVPVDRKAVVDHGLEVAMTSAGEEQVLFCARHAVSNQECCHSW